MLSVLTTSQRGLVAETAILHECVKVGIGVSRPLDDERYDLIIDLRPRLLRVQCKLARRQRDIVRVRLYTSRRGPNGMVVRAYDSREVDVFGVYCPETSCCYLLPAAEFEALQVVHLRLAPSNNSQVAGIRWARDYVFGATLSRLQGPIAQLGEHLHGMQKVAGSSPAGSTI
jgi:hypothetical protein